MKHGLLLIGVVAAGISAAYLLDEKRGSKRRKILKRKADRILKEAAHRWNDYSQELKPHWDKYRKEFAEGAQKVTEQSIQHVEQAHNGWAPSARLLGATASAMAFYGSGRKGMVGTLMRIVSLGLFTRALLASR